MSEQTKKKSTIVVKYQMDVSSRQTAKQLQGNDFSNSVKSDAKLITSFSKKRTSNL